MKDKILESYIADFVASNNIDSSDEAKVFEYFVNHLVLTRIHPENTDFESTTVGGDDDLGIDGLAILVNEHIVTSAEEVKYFKTNLRRLDVQFIFTQSKTADKFAGAEIDTFLYGVQRFFDDVPIEKLNANVRKARMLKDIIYKSSIDMDYPPICTMYYATNGKWVDEPYLTERVNTRVDTLKKTGLFSDVKFVPIDSDSIKNLYKELKLKIVKEINFDKHAILPKVQGIQEAYIGILPCKEYLRLISDSDGNLMRQLFYDNVRDFQGNNPVNREIEETLKDGSMNDKFSLFNNGITIVAHSINKVGTAFKIKDYQIVNGCQTSHIIYRNRSVISDAASLSIKLIVTEDLDITNQIIKATNRQTEVKIEAFESLSPFQKKLEEFYSACGKEAADRLYYERRSKQYEHLSIKRHQIISLTDQIKCFVAMFLNEPQSTPRYYGELLQAYREKMFIENHSAYPYYISCLTLHVLERLMSDGRLNRKYRAFRYQILLLFRILVEKRDIPYLNSKEIDKYCSEIHDTLLDSAKAQEALGKTIEIIKEALESKRYPLSEASRLRDFTSDIVKRALDIRRKSKSFRVADVERESGVVTWFSDIKGFGFIQSDNMEKLFVHYSNIRGRGYKNLIEGQKVEFTIVKGERGLTAQDVAILQ
ncbi:MAG: AIPR family protein [Nitrospirota bacterium]